MAPSTVRDLPPGDVSKPSGRQIIAQYLGPRALRGELRDGTVPGCYVVEGVDVFSASPDELPFQPSHGEVWGYFFANQPHPAGDMRPAPGGCWVRYGPEKGYQHGGVAVAFRRRFAFHATWMGGDGRATWAPTRWLMKEYRLNKGAAAFRRVQPDPRVNMDCVVRKVFTKPMVPPSPPPPSSSSEEEIPPASSYPGVDEEAGYSSDEDQARKRVGYCNEGPARKRARSS